MRTFFTSIMFVLISCMCGFGELNDKAIALTDGIYHGRLHKSALRLPHVVFVVVKDDKVQVELYQHLKGQTIKVLMDELVSTNNQINVSRFGREMELFNHESTLYLKARSKKARARFDCINLCFAPEKEPFLHECRNLSYLFEDFDRLRAFIREKRGDHWVGRPEDLCSKYGIFEMAKSLRHSEFLEKYMVIREQVVSEILGMVSVQNRDPDAKKTFNPLGR